MKLYLFLMFVCKYQVNKTKSINSQKKTILIKRYLYLYFHAKQLLLY